MSLAQDTFVSSGASVKASLLVMQKFTKKDKADYDKKRAGAEKETRARYEPEILKETARLAAEIEAAKTARDVKRGKNLQDELRRYTREMEVRIRSEARALLKERFQYPVFLYEAEKVGITSTGEAGQNELYPNPNQPPGTEGKTCLELYRAFVKDPKLFSGQGV